MRSSVPGVLRRIAELLVRGRHAPFILADLDEAYERDRARGLGARRALWRYTLNMVQSGIGLMARGLVEAAGDLADDVRAAARALRREPVFVVVAVTTLAVGVGSTATVFGMANQLLFRPVPGVSEAERVAYVWLESADDSLRSYSRGMSRPEVDAMVESASLLDAVGEYGFSFLHVEMAPGRNVQIAVNSVYGDYFGALGVVPAHGRLFRTEETTPEAEPLVAVISQSLSMRLFGTTESSGRTVQVEGHPVTVLGVTGGGFRGVVRHVEVDMWLPKSALIPFHDFSLEVLSSPRNTMYGNLVARFAPGVTADAAADQLTVIAHRLGRERPDSDRLLRLKATVRPGLTLPAGSRVRIYESLRVFGGAVGIVLLIACANVATLLLVRSVRRRGALATRRALGASSGRITRYHLVENAVLATLGAVAGLVVARLLSVVVRGARLPGMPAFDSFTIDIRVLGFAVVAAMVTVLLFGAVPAILAGRFGLANALRSAGDSGPQHFGGLRRILCVAQVGLCITLLVGATLLTRTVRNLYAIDTGLNIDGITLVDLGGPSGFGDPEGVGDRYQALLADIGRIPGVAGASLAMDGPLASTGGTRVSLPAAPDDGINVQFRPVSAGWFDLLGLEVVHGEGLPRAIWQGGTIPVVFTSALAEQLYGSSNAVGRRLLVNVGSMAEAEVVGITEDIYMPDAPTRPTATFFMPLEAFPHLKAVVAVVRAEPITTEVVAGIRAAAARVTSNVVSDPIAVAARFDQLFAEQRVFNRLLTILAGLAAGLAAIGLYGVIAFAVAQRTKEFGVRVALGAGARRISGLVALEAGAIVLVGTVAGLFGAYVLSMLIESRLYGLEPLDPISYGAAVLLFAAVALVACWMPARTAATADPMVALRQG